VNGEAVTAGAALGPGAEPNRYSVRAVRGERGWEVHVVDPEGRVALVRPCGTEAEARTFASTVEQHIFWLSPGKFREYYRLE
jgi:hypothetical protein